VFRYGESVGHACHVVCDCPQVLLQIASVMLGGKEARFFRERTEQVPYDAFRFSTHAGNSIVLIKMPTQELLELEGFTPNPGTEGDEGRARPDSVDRAWIRR
jgi:hypothetical protein